MKSRFLVLLVAVGLLSLPTLPTHAERLPQAWMLQNCVNSPEDPCVKSIWIVTKDGQRIEAKLTGRSSRGEGVPGHDASNEYSIEGMTFEEPAQNLMVNRVYYDGTWIQTVVEATWLNQSSKDFTLELPRRKTNLLCGTVANPGKCYRNVRFNQEFTVEQELRLPEEFVLSFLNARSDYLRFETGYDRVTINGKKFVTTKLIFNVTEKQQVLFSALQPDPLATSDYADFVVDQSIVNLYSPESWDGQRLGKCSRTPSLSVVSNGINPETPQWDASNEAITVNIAGPHYKVDGTLNAGFFEARISKALGVCLWGIDLSKKIKAVLSITDNGISQEVQTLTTKMDGQEFVVRATNFHFSTPRITLKLKNEVEEIPVQVKEEAPVVTKPVLKRISCVKGKTVKKFSGANPKCPKGYKLKSSA